MFRHSGARPVTDTLHGYRLTDPYRWLEDKTDPEVQKWTRAQHDATLNYIDTECPSIPGLREEIQAYIDRDIESPMQLVADRQFFTRRKKGEKQSKLYTLIDGKELLLFDPEAIDPSGKSSLSGRSFTEDGSRVAVGMQSKGAEISTYYIIDTQTGKVLGNPVEGLRAFSWTKDEQHAYIWVRTQETVVAHKRIEVRLQKVGSDRSEDITRLVPADFKNAASVGDARYADLTSYSEGDLYATHSLGMKQTGAVDEPVEI